MLNSEKFKTASERTIAFDVYCRKVCTKEDGYCNHAECAFSWLEREAEEIIGEYLGRIWEDSKFNRALLYYDSELRRLKNDDQRASRC